MSDNTRKKKRIEDELEKICKEILHILDKNLINNT